MSRSEADRRAAEAALPDEAILAPYGRVRVGENNGTLTLSIPHEIVEDRDIEQGDEFCVGFDPDSNELRYVDEDEFDGW